MKKAYLKPDLRLINILQEQSILASNTEPIDDDGQEHGWD